jgi:hypothetical protein
MPRAAHGRRGRWRHRGWTREGRRRRLGWLAAAVWACHTIGQMERWADTACHMIGQMERWADETINDT